MHSSSRAIERGLGAGIISFVVYLVVVVVSTPNLRPADSIDLALTLNWWVVGWVSVGTGIQIFLVTYAKDKVCPIRHTRSTVGTSGIFSGAASFLSFLSLIPIGCCGTWLYLISFLPGLIGSGLSGFLLVNGHLLAFGSLVLLSVSVVYTYVSVKRRLNLVDQVTPKLPN